MPVSSTKSKAPVDQPIRIDPQLHRRLKIRCAEIGSTMRHFVETLIRRALEKGDEQ